MEPIFAILDFNDYAIIALIVFFCGVLSIATQQRVNIRRLERKVDALLEHLGAQLPTRLSPEVQRLAREPNQKIAAIKLHRAQNPGLGLAEAKKDVEEFAGEV